MRLQLFLCVLLVCVAAASAAAQEPAPAPAAETQAPQPQPLVDLFRKAASYRWEQISRDHIRYTGQAEIEGATTRFFADQIDVFTDTNRLEASGNVVFAGPEGRIAAERVEFDLANNTGRFHTASGVMSLGATVDRAAFGGQDPDVLFYGDLIEKLGDRRYRVSNGGFTTCVQPTPRWEVTSGSVTLNLNEYAIARNTVLRVKGVPMFYLPVLYYPIQDDDRATGFLLPTYGTSTVQGQSISNAFFWAINRSQDATFFHDWFTRTGQGFGGEYRYVWDAQSSGNARVYRLNQSTSTITQGGIERDLPESRSYRVTANVIQVLTPRIRARARVDYFTDIVTQQLYQQNVYYATQASRVIDAGLNAAHGPLSTSFQYSRSEYFSSPTVSTVSGYTPRATANLAPRALAGARLYASVNGEVARMPNEVINDGITTSDRGITRGDVQPTLRVPMSSLTFLSVNTTAGYRATGYSKRQDATGALVADPLLRQYFTVRTEVIGPVLSKIWDTPDSRATDRMKHVIEPGFAVDYVTDFANAAQVPSTSGISDAIVGGSTRFTYGVTNRFFYRTRPAEGGRTTTREFVTIGLQQTYYTEPLASRSDTSYQSASQRASLVDLSPIALTARVSPTAALDANARIEYDVSGAGLQVLSTGATANFGRNSSTLLFSRSRYSRVSPVTSYLTSSTTMRFSDGRVAATYAINWDIARSYVLSQSAMLSYMAQCCGFQVDFQNYNYGASSSIPFAANRRFNVSFVLAGLGTFSNFFGAFGAR